MAYTPTTWATGDTITATKLNKIEQGIADGGSGALIVHSTYNSVKGKYCMDKTVQEIYDSLSAGVPVYCQYIYGTISDFTGYTFLAPIIMIYNYDRTNVIRVVVNHASNIGGISSYGYMLTTSVALYEASGVSDYPGLYAIVGPVNSGIL